MSPAVAPLAEFTVLIEDAKFEKYLQTTKLGKLQKAGLAELTKAELETAIRSKLRMNYLYKLALDCHHFDCPSSGSISTL